MVEPKELRTAKELAEELIPALETLANICFLKERSLEPLKREELLRAESRAVETLVRSVERELQKRGGKRSG
jgi:hypothetical protein